jgi:hypothetical protein
METKDTLSNPVELTGCGLAPELLHTLGLAFDLAARTIDRPDTGTRKRLARHLLECAEGGERNVFKLALFALEGLNTDNQCN